MRMKGGQFASSFSELHLNVAKMLHEIVVTFQYSYKRCSCLGKCNTYVKETYVHKSRCPHQQALHTCTYLLASVIDWSVQALLQ